MKKSTKITIAVFFVLAFGLYATIYLIPKVQGLSEKTTLLEYGDLPIQDEAELCLIRNETLFLAGQSGKIEDQVEEGTKVRKGVHVLQINGTAAPAKTEDDGEAKTDETQETQEAEDVYAALLKKAGASAVVAEDGNAAFTAVVSYYADGYEGELTPGAIDALSYEAVSRVPEANILLDRPDVKVGDPIYKLTDNNLWYMVFWLSAESGHGEVVNYEEGTTVNVDLGATRVEAVVDRLVQEGNQWKVVLRSDVYYRDLPKQRKLKAKVVFDEFKGLVIDVQSIVVKGEQPGVFVRQRNNSFKWVPVEIRKTADERCLVSFGSYADKEGNTVDTVNYYDEILTDPRADGYA